MDSNPVGAQTGFVSTTNLCVSEGVLRESFFSWGSWRVGLVGAKPSQKLAQGSPSALWSLQSPASVSTSLCFQLEAILHFQIPWSKLILGCTSSWCVSTVMNCETCRSATMCTCMCRSTWSQVCLPLSHCLAAEGSDMKTIPSS